jgi:hypothetical protein
VRRQRSKPFFSPMKGQILKIVGAQFSWMKVKKNGDVCPFPFLLISSHAPDYNIFI